MAFLQVVEGPGIGDQYTIEGPRTVLGRHPDCDVVLEVAAVSRQHAEVSEENSQFFIQDLGSRNGTYVNGSLISGLTPITQGDKIKICDLTFTFLIHELKEDLAGPLLTGGSSMAMLVDDRSTSTGNSTIMKTFDVSNSIEGRFLSARPEVKLRAMIEIAHNIGKAIALDQVLPKLLDSLFKIFVQADRGFVVLRGSDGKILIPKAVKHRRGGDEETIRISRTIVNQAMESGEAILSADAASDERFNMAQSIADFQIRSMMCAPLIAFEGPALGVIQIDTLDRQSRFTADDLEVLASVASQAAVAVENAQLHERTLQQQKIERDLELAHRVQKGLLPSAAPQVPGYHFFSFYEAANQVGGDYYDYVPLGEGRMAVVLGDVSGKGVAAALMMAKLSGDVRFCLASESDPAVAVSRINQLFADNGWEDRFVTLVVAVVDSRSHQCTIVNAGHMPPMLRHSNGQIVEVGEEQTGLPVGVVEDYEFEAFTCKLEPGDSLTLFTDGISEAMNASKDLYGLENLRVAVGASAVSVADLGRHILDDVRKFVSGQPQSDDMCVACFGRDEG